MVSWPDSILSSIHSKTKTLVYMSPMLLQGLKNVLNFPLLKEYCVNNNSFIVNEQAINLRNEQGILNIEKLQE